MSARRRARSGPTQRVQRPQRPEADELRAKSLSPPPESVPADAPKYAAFVAAGTSPTRGGARPSAASLALVWGRDGQEHVRHVREEFLIASCRGWHWYGAAGCRRRMRQGIRRNISSGTWRGSWTGTFATGSAGCLSCTARIFDWVVDLRCRRQAGHGDGWPGRVLLKIVYVLTCRIAGLVVVLFRGDRATVAGVLVLWNETGARRAGRARAVRAGGPGLVRHARTDCATRRRARVFPVTPATMLAPRRPGWPPGAIRHEETSRAPSPAVCQRLDARVIWRASSATCATTSGAFPPCSASRRAGRTCSRGRAS